jgi:hypothetical protein
MQHPPVIVLELYFLEFDGLIRLIHRALISHDFDKSFRSYIILEYFSKKARTQQAAWSGRKSDKKYKIRFPASLALALHEWIRTRPVNDFQQAFYRELDQRLTNASLVDQHKQLN